MNLKYNLNDRPPMGQLLGYSLQWFVMAVAVVSTSVFVAQGSAAEKLFFAQSAFVILDEAQNTTLSQIKMFLTRMGRNAKFIVTGDVTQIDLPRRSDSGLTKAMDTLRNIEGIGIVEFDKRDIVRHRLVKYIVDAFDKREAIENGLLKTDKKSE